jgi:hypothetical protein
MTGREAVVNKALSGIELREILKADFERLLDAEGLLSHYVAYNRIGYDLTLRLHLDNPYYPESAVAIASKSSEAHPGVEPAPLRDASDEAIASGQSLHRDIASPNAERLRHGLTLPVETRGQDGTVQIEQVRYPPQPELGPGEVTITDTTKETREAWKIPSTSK